MKNCPTGTILNEFQLYLNPWTHHISHSLGETCCRSITYHSLMRHRVLSIHIFHSHLHTSPTVAPTQVEFLVDLAIIRCHQSGRAFQVVQPWSRVPGKQTMATESCRKGPYDKFPVSCNAWGVSIPAGGEQIGTQDKNSTVRSTSPFGNGLPLEKGGARPNMGRIM